MKKKRIRIFVEGDSLQSWASKAVGRKLSAADIRALVRHYGSEIDYFLHICNKRDEKAAREFENGGLHVHRTDLSTKLARSYRPKAEEALADGVFAAARLGVDRAVLVTGAAFEAFEPVFEAAGPLKFRVSMFAPKVPKKRIGLIDEFIKLDGSRFGRKSPDEPLAVFISYSHKDEALREELETQLKLMQRRNMISVWHDRKIDPGDEWKGQLDDNLESAAIILLLVSADFIASDYCYDVEMKRALERHNHGARVIPVILRNVDWSTTRFAKLQGLPKDGRPVVLWPDRDSAWKDVAKGISKAVESIRSKQL
jgi:TIR domain